MTVPDAVHVIATLVDEGVERVGAGTVRTLTQLHACVDAGATFIVSPHLDPDLVKAAVTRGVPVVPGCLTPSEIAHALALGASAVKLFPVSSVGGVAYVRAVLEPMPDARFVVSGEVTLPRGGRLSVGGRMGGVRRTRTVAAHRRRERRRRSGGNLRGRDADRVATHPVNRAGAAYSGPGGTTMVTLRG